MDALEVNEERDLAQTELLNSQVMEFLLVPGYNTQSYLASNKHKKPLEPSKSPRTAMPLTNSAVPASRGTDTGHFFLPG